MKTYAELGNVYRKDPCVEYPGEWALFCPSVVKTVGEKVKTSFDNLDSAIKYADGLFCKLENAQVEYNTGDFSIGWICSDNDPRVGETWFTGLYIAGKFNRYGQYRST